MSRLEQNHPITPKNLEDLMARVSEEIERNVRELEQISRDRELAIEDTLRLTEENDALKQEKEKLRIELRDKAFVTDVARKQAVETMQRSFDEELARNALRIAELETKNTEFQELRKASEEQKEDLENQVGELISRQMRIGRTHAVSVGDALRRRRSTMVGFSATGDSEESGEGVGGERSVRFGGRNSTDTSALDDAMRRNSTLGRLSVATSRLNKTRATVTQEEKTIRSATTATEGRNVTSDQIDEINQKLVQAEQESIELARDGLIGFRQKYSEDLRDCDEDMRASIKKVLVEVGKEIGVEDDSQIDGFVTKFFDDEKPEFAELVNGEQKELQIPFVLYAFEQWAENAGGHDAKNAVKQIKSVYEVVNDMRTEARSESKVISSDDDVKQLSRAIKNAQIFANPEKSRLAPSATELSKEERLKAAKGRLNAVATELEDALKQQEGDVAKQGECSVICCELC